MSDGRCKREVVRMERDTVYVERRDSVMVSNTNLTNPMDKKSNFVRSLKWLFGILVAGIVLVVVLRFGRLLKC
jgi:hypothetical protein